MHCRECGKKCNEKAVACTSCGTNPRLGRNFCNACGVKTKDNQVVCLKCGVSLGSSGGSSSVAGGEKSKMIAFVLGFFLGTLGLHKFYLGSGKPNTQYNTPGIIQLILGIVTCGFAGLIGLVEGIIYVTKSDEEFQEMYIDNEKPWF